VPSYAGFASLREYLEARCTSQQLSFNELSVKLGWAHTYVAAIATERFIPSRTRADKIAKFFGDDVRLVRILCGLELLPTADDPILSAIRDVAAGLAPADRRELLRYATYLKEKDKR
jgi:transcriptional regulator with XRE-family HTH domain